MFFTLWEYFIIVLENSLFFILLDKKLTLHTQDKQRTYILQIIYLLIGSILLLILNLHNLSSIYTVAWSIAFHFLYALIFFSDTLFPKLLWTIIYSAFALISDALSAIVPIYLLHYSTAAVLNGTGIIRIVFTLLYILIFSLLILFVLVLDNRTFHISKSERLVFSVISTLCIIIEQTVLVSIIDSYHTATDKALYIQVIIFTLVFLLFFSLIYYVYRLGVEKEKYESLVEDNLLTKLNNIQYEQVIASIEELRILKHDINNHLATLALLINSEEPEEASEYINKIMNDLGQQHRLISSGNLPIDCIVSNKLIIAQKKDIPIDCLIHLPTVLPLNGVDICSLLGNLLDNAIEGCSGVSSPNSRFIHLIVKPFNNMLSIKIENASNGIYSMNKAGNFISNKVDSHNSINHGLGIKQVNNIVEKYNGFIRFTPEKNIFTVEILFPLNQKAEAEVK